MSRMIGGALFFQLLVRGRRVEHVAISRLDHVRLVGLSILGIAANQTLFLLGLRWTTPFSVSLLGATIPVFTAGLAVVFGKERASGRTLAGIALALSGVLSLTGLGSHGPQVDRGVLLVAANSLSYSAFVVLSRDVVLRVGAARSVAWLFTYGAALFAPLGVGALASEIPRLTPRGIAYVAYIVLVPTIVAYGLNTWALARSSATLVTIYIYVQPLIAGLIAWVQLGHRVEGRAAISAVLILAGLGVVSSRQPAPAVVSSPSRPRDE